MQLNNVFYFHSGIFLLIFRLIKLSFIGIICNYKVQMIMNNFKEISMTLNTIGLALLFQKIWGGQIFEKIHN